MPFPYSSYLKIPWARLPDSDSKYENTGDFPPYVSQRLTEVIPFSKYGFPTAKIGCGIYSAMECLFILTIKMKVCRKTLLPAHFHLLNFNLFKLCVIQPSSLKSFYNKLLAREMFLFSQQNPTNKYIKIN